jgi:hypothetical protein
MGLALAVAVPPVAATAVRDGMEKNVFSHAAGAAAVMLASFVTVTVSGLLAWPLAATVIGVVSVWEVPLVAVEKFQMTLLVVDEHPVWAVVRALVVNPAAIVVFVGKLKAVIVTG